LWYLPLTFNYSTYSQKQYWSKVRGIFRKILWPSQNIWNLTPLLHTCVIYYWEIEKNETPYQVAGSKLWNYLPSMAQIPGFHHFKKISGLKYNILDLFLLRSKWVLRKSFAERWFFYVASFCSADALWSDF
jgi:hypothetical protein